MKLKEFVVKYNALITEIKEMEGKNTADEIQAKITEAETLKNEIDVLEKARALEVKNILGSEEHKGEIEMEKTYNNEVLKRMLAKKGTEEDFAVYKAQYAGQKESVDADGGYLVPKEQITKLYEYKETLDSLDQYITVIPVSTLSGTMPLEVKATDTLQKIEEGAKFDISKATFGQVEFKVSKYADMYQVTQELLDDGAIDIVGYLQRRIGKKSVRTANKEIIALLKTIGSPIEVSKKADGLEKLNDAIYSLDPVFRKNGLIITNSNGARYLNGLSDKNGQPLVRESFRKPGTKEILGLTLIERSNEELENDDTNKAPFFIGSLEEYITKFDRKTLELATSEDFYTDSTYIRGIERFQYKVIDSASMKYVKIDLSK